VLLDKKLEIPIAAVVIGDKIVIMFPKVFGYMKAVNEIVTNTPAIMTGMNRLLSLIRLQLQWPTI
jgi:hypothetical protein